MRLRFRFGVSTPLWKLILCRCDCLLVNSGNTFVITACYGVDFPLEVITIKGDDCLLAHITGKYCFHLNIGNYLCSE